MGSRSSGSSGGRMQAAPGAQATRPFKLRKSFATRLEEVAGIRAKFPTKIPIPVTVMKPDEKAEIPIGVVIGSILAGLLLLLILVAVLWKVGFFKRQYEKMTQDIEDIDEITELTKDKD